MFQLIVAVNRNGFALDINDYDTAADVSAAVQFHPDIDITAQRLDTAEAFMAQAAAGDTLTLTDFRTHEPVAVIVCIGAETSDMKTRNASLCNNITSAVRAWVDDASEDGDTLRALTGAIDRAEAEGVAGSTIRAAIDRGTSSRTRDDVHRAIGAVGYDYVCNLNSVRS